MHVSEAVQACQASQGGKHAKDLTRCGTLTSDRPVPVQVWFMQLQDGPEGPHMQLACAQEYPSTITAVATSGMHGAAICAGADTCLPATCNRAVPDCADGREFWQPAVQYVIQSTAQIL